jgi:hypothetical protein
MAERGGELIRSSGLITVVCVDNRSINVLWATATYLWPPSTQRRLSIVLASRHVDKSIISGDRSNDSVSWQRPFMDHFLSLVAGEPFVVNWNQIIRA